MPSVTDTLKAAVARKNTAPGDLKFELSQAEDILAALESQYGDLALDAHLKEQGAKSRLDAINAELTAGRAKVAELKVIIAASEKRAADLLSAQRASLQETQLAAFGKHLDLRDQAAKTFAAAIKEAATAYRAMQEHTTKALAATPIMTQLPNAVFGEDDIRRMCGGEAWRYTSGAIGGDPLALPGAAAATGDQIGDPQRMKPIADELAEETTYLKQFLKKQIAG
jgi:hypothetical protein